MIHRYRFIAILMNNKLIENFGTISSKKRGRLSIHGIIGKII